MKENRHLSRTLAITSKSGEVVVFLCILGRRGGMAYQEKAGDAWDPKPWCGIVLLTNKLTNKILGQWQTREAQTAILQAFLPYGTDETQLLWNLMSPSTTWQGEEEQGLVWV